MAKSRVVVADALRAFALLGIAVAHASNEYLGIPPFDYTNRFTEGEKLLGPWIDLLNLPMQLNRLRMQVLGATAAEKADEKQLMAEVERLTREDLRIKQTSSVAELVGWKLRTAFWWKALFQLFAERIFVTIGLFFLGVAL